MMLITEDGQLITGRLSGPALFPQALLTVRDAVQANVPVIGAGGVGSKTNADAMLSVGALAVPVKRGSFYQKSDPRPSPLRLGGALL